jgi:hypothetical protein
MAEIFPFSKVEKSMAGVVLELPVIKQFRMQWARVLFYLIKVVHLPASIELLQWAQNPKQRIQW